jgi:hypothetical protein
LFHRAAADAIKFTVDQTTLKKKAQLSNGSNSITKAAATAPDLTPTASSKPAPGKRGIPQEDRGELLVYPDLNCGPLAEQPLAMQLVFGSTSASL